jgi:hypothetical protein
VAGVRALLPLRMLRHGTQTWWHQRVGEMDCSSARVSPDDDVTWARGLPQSSARRSALLMIRTEDEMNRNVGEYQSLPWFLSSGSS